MGWVPTALNKDLWLGSSVICRKINEINSSSPKNLLIWSIFVFPDTSKKLAILHWISYFASFAGIILVLLARGHYTIDVLIAYYATTRTFWIYHTLANYTHLKVLYIVLPLNWTCVLLIISYLKLRLKFLNNSHTFLSQILY